MLWSVRLIPKTNVRSAYGCTKISKCSSRLVCFLNRCSSVFKLQIGLQGVKWKPLCGNLTLTLTILSFLSFIFYILGCFKLLCIKARPLFLVSFPLRNCQTTWQGKFYWQRLHICRHRLQLVTPTQVTNHQQAQPQTKQVKNLRKNK